LMEGDVPKQAGNDHPTSIPTGVFPTTDGHINIAAAGEVMFARLCKAMGFPELIDDPHYKTGPARSANRAALNERIAEVTRTDSSAAWVDRLNAAEVPCGPIYAMNEVFADLQVKHLGMAQAVEHPTLGRTELVGQAIKLSRTPAKLETATPAFGEHTDEVLGELGYDAAKISDLRARKVV
jgi:crotonobetainyl-CoA:carnitine CoA-transferase CaiB-like acyl-CoA transferase